MDPSLTFADFLLALAEGRFACAAEHASNLRDWLDKGGFLPADMVERNPEITRQQAIDWLGAYAAL
jgi:hypothetical protein